MSVLVLVLPLGLGAGVLAALVVLRRAIHLQRSSHFAFLFSEYAQLLLEDPATPQDMRAVLLELARLPPRGWRARRVLRAAEAGDPGDRAGHPATRRLTGLLAGGAAQRERFAMALYFYIQALSYRDFFLGDRLRYRLALEPSVLRSVPPLVQAGAPWLLGTTPYVAALGSGGHNN